MTLAFSAQLSDWRDREAAFCRHAQNNSGKVPPICLAAFLKNVMAALDRRTVIAVY